MSERPIRIAGTSFGGSSYSARVQQVILSSPQGTTVVMIVSAGEKQEQVMRSLEQQCSTLNDTIKKVSGVSSGFAYRIEKESK